MSQERWAPSPGKKKIRVHELARDLGMTNAEVLDLCQVLGVRAKGPSSSLAEAFADMIRRRAERDGLTRDVQPPAPTRPTSQGSFKIRIHELARELGMTNAEILLLCERLGVAAAGPSSSLASAYADMVRRRAHRDGLNRVAQPTDPEMSEDSIAAFELARELGVRLHEVLADCERLGVRVGGNSLSIRNPDAARVRRSHSSRRRATEHAPIGQRTMVRALAKQLGLPPGHVLQTARALGFEVVSLSSPLNPSQVDAIRASLRASRSEEPSPDPRVMVRELASELDRSYEEVLQSCRELKLAATGPSSPLKPADAERVRKHVRKDRRSGAGDSMASPVIERTPTSGDAAAKRRAFALYPQILDAAAAGDLDEANRLLNEYGKVAPAARVALARRQAEERLQRNSVDAHHREEWNQWLDGGQSAWMAAGWNRKDEKAVLEYLFQRRRRWAGPQLFDYSPDPDWLDEILARAESLAPRLKLEPRWPAHFAGDDIEVIVWVDRSRLLGWVGTGDAGIPITVNTRHWDVRPADNGTNAVVAAGVAISWFLDCSLGHSTGGHPHFLGDRKTGKADEGSLLAGEAPVMTPTASFTRSVRSQRAGASSPPRAHRVRGHIRTLAPGHSPTYEARSNAPAYVRRNLGDRDTFVQAHQRGGERQTNELLRHLERQSSLADALGGLA